MWLISKQSILTEEIDVAANTIRKTRDFINIINKEKENLTKDIANVFKRYSDESLKRRIEQLSEEIIVDMTNRLSSGPKEVTTYESPKPSIATDIGGISRNDINGSPDDEIAVFPSRESGVEFLKKYNAWGYVRINRKPKYLALYVSRPYSKVVYFGEIDYITNPFESKDEIKNIEEADKTTFSPGKQVVYLKKDSLVKLSDPIPAGPRGSVPFSLSYSTLDKLKSARNTKELWH